MKNHLVSALLLVLALGLETAGFAGAIALVGAGVTCEVWFWMRLVRGDRRASQVTRASEPLSRPLPKAALPLEEDTSAAASPSQSEQRKCGRIYSSGGRRRESARVDVIEFIEIARVVGTDPRELFGRLVE